MAHQFLSEADEPPDAGWSFYSDKHQLRELVEKEKGRNKLMH
jgi:hypothetical protein